MKTAKELRDLSKDELVDFIEECSREIYQARNEIRMTKNVEKPHLIREKKTERARAMTILSETKKGA